MYASIALPVPTRDLFTYSVPEGMRATLKPGMRVHVPIGNRFAVGLAVEIHETAPDFNTKPIHALLDQEPVMDESLLAATRHVAESTYASWGEAIQAALPLGLNFVSEKRIQVGDPTLDPSNHRTLLQDVAESGSMLLEEAERRWGSRLIASLVGTGLLRRVDEPRRRVGDAEEWVTGWADGGRDALASILADPKRRKAAWLTLAEALESLDLPLPVGRLMEETGLRYNQVRRLVDLGVLVSYRTSRDRRTERIDDPWGPLAELNGEQVSARDRILAAFDAPGVPFLLFGVTGSGKTEVYIHALAECRRRGRGGIVMVPEIALTPQTVNRFRRVFGESIAVLHSRLTDRERYNAWIDIRSGRKRIVIGARSAVFAPVPDLGLIVIDEEHDASYRQDDPAPRYDAREVACWRAAQTGAVMVLGSATPSLTSLFAAAKGDLSLLRLTGRHGTAVMPPVRVLDLRQYRKAMRGPLAIPAYEAVKSALDRGEQAIVLYNRRGYARFLLCEACGHTPECPECSVTLTYHRTTDTLRCHYCGHSRRSPKTCPSCDDPAIVEQGSGTQKVEEELAALYPSARILRMDRDTTSKRDAHASILNRFGSGGADILVGTQLVSKGLDFPNVTVVVVVNSDTELAFPSYDNAERMFQLLTQVAGRSGRAGKPGEVWLQTYKADHPAIRHAAEHDFEGFARTEMASRRAVGWPPYSRLITFQFKGKDSDLVAKAAHVFARIVEQEAGSAPVLGPSPSSVYRIQSDYRWELLVKADPKSATADRAAWLDRIFTKYRDIDLPGSSTVRINVHT